MYLLLRLRRQPMPRRIAVLLRERRNLLLEILLMLPPGIGERAGLADAGDLLVVCRRHLLLLLVGFVLLYG